MKIKNAIKKAKDLLEWVVRDKEPVSVNVAFQNSEGEVDVTQVDLFESTPRKKEIELEDIWESLAKEMDSDIDSVVSVETCKYTDH